MRGEGDRDKTGKSPDIKPPKGVGGAIPQLPENHLFMTYQDYLKSEHWKKVRARTIKNKRTGRVCRVCARWSNYIEIHHHTYRKLGKERPRDVAPVCRNCHELIHQTHKEHPNWSLRSTFNRVRRRLYGGLSWRKRIVGARTKRQVLQSQT